MEGATLLMRTEERDTYSADCGHMNVFVRDKPFLDTSSHTDEMVNHSWSTHFGPPVEVTAFSTVMPTDELHVVKDEIDQSFGVTDDCTDISADYDNAKDEIEQSADEVDNSDEVIADFDDEGDAAEYVDRVFFACDPDGTGTVAVSDIISYLSDTLHVSDYLHLLCCTSYSIF